MKYKLATLALLVLISISASSVKGQLIYSQAASISGYFSNASHTIKLPQTILSNFNYKITSPSSLPLNSSYSPGNPFSVGSVSAQSFNNGKFGRCYNWDAQGNLRSSYLFVDISGKKKRGLKLVFTKHRLIIDTRNKVIM